MAYVYRGDIFLQDVKTGMVTRVTQTEEFENSPRFIMKDEWLVYNRNQNLFAWNRKTGITRQLTNITKADPATTGVFNEK